MIGIEIPTNIPKVCFNWDWNSYEYFTGIGIHMSIPKLCFSF